MPVLSATELKTAIGQRAMLMREPEELALLADPPACLVNLTEAELADRRELDEFDARHALILALLDRAQPWLTRAQFAVIGLAAIAVAWAWHPVILAVILGWLA